MVAFVPVHLLYHRRNVMTFLYNLDFFMKIRLNTYQRTRNCFCICVCVSGVMLSQMEKSFSQQGQMLKTKYVYRWGQREGVRKRKKWDTYLVCFPVFLPHFLFDLSDYRFVLSKTWRFVVCLPLPCSKDWTWNTRWKEIEGRW